VHSRGILSKPSEARIGGGPAISVLLEPRNSAIVDHFTALITPRRIDHLAHRHLPHIARDDTIDQPRRILASEPVLEQRRNINQRRSIANRVVLMFMVRLIGANRIVSRPLAIAKTLAERECPFVKRSSDWHRF